MPDTLKVQFQEGEDSKVVLNGDRVVEWLFSQMYWNTQLPLSMHKIIHRDYSELLENPGIFLPLANFSYGPIPAKNSFCRAVNGNLSWKG